MYNARFRNNNGLEFSFGFDNVFDLQGNSGINVNVGTAQSFSQIGETVQSLSINGNTIIIKGVFFRDAVEIGKTNIKKVISPLSSGKLIFNDKYYINVNVKVAPQFSPVKKNLAFYVELFAPYPFFKKIEENVTVIGGLIPSFMFPINYATPHKFATKSPALFEVVANNGDLFSDFKVVFISNGHIENIALTELKTLKKTTFKSAVLEVDEQLIMYRDYNGYIRVTLIDKDGNVSDKFQWLDEDSDLFELMQGDNIIKAEAMVNNSNLSTEIIFNEVQTGVYDDN